MCLASTALLSGAQAAPQRAGAGRPAGTVAIAVAVRPQGGSATIPPPPDPNSDYGIQFDPISTRVRKAKVSFSLPPLSFRSYLLVCFLTSTFQSPCPGHDVSRFPTLPFPYTWDVAFADNWVARLHHGQTQFGVFPPVRVNTLAFGGIPISATAQLTQTVTKGVYDPMRLELPLDISAIPPGRRIPGFGPAPKFPQGTTFFSYRAFVKGTVDIRLTHLVVDQVPLPVGPDCHTATPAVLRLSAPAGYYPQNVPPTQLKGKPGEFQPLGGGGPAGYLSGSADVPAFTGCHNGGDDLNPLITGMISGSGNPVNAYSPHGLQSWCLEPVAHCSTGTTAAQRQLRLLASGARPVTAADIPAAEPSAVRAPAVVR